MTTLIIVLAILSLYHFVYEGIIAPSERANLRYDFFALRDRLRMTKIEYGKRLDDSIFNDMELSINKAIKILPIFNLYFIYKGYLAQKTHLHLLTEIAKKNHAIKTCEVKEVQEIHNQANKLIAKAFLINTGGWMLYALLIIVFLLGIVFVWNLKKKLISFLKLQVERATYLPNNDFELIPEYVC